MKKYIAIFILLAFIFAVSGCKSKNNTSENSGQNNNNGNSIKKFDIVMVAKQEGIAQTDDMRVGVEDFKKKYAGEVNARLIAPAGGDSKKQVRMVEDLITQKVDAICVFPIDPTAMKPALKRAKDSGIVVITTEASQIADIADYDVEPFRNRDFGILLFDSLAKAIGGNGEFAAMIGGSDIPVEMEWYNAGMDYIKENYPKMKMVLTQPTEDNNNEDIARNKTLEILNSNPYLKGVVSTSMLSGTNFAAALKAKKNKDIAVVSVGVPSVVGPYLKETYMSKSLTWRPADQGYVSCLAALKVIKAEKIENGTGFDRQGYESIDLDGKIIYGSAPLILTSENVNNYSF